MASANMQGNLAVAPQVATNVQFPVFGSYNTSAFLSVFEEPELADFQPFANFFLDERLNQQGQAQIAVQTQDLGRMLKMPSGQNAQGEREQGQGQGQLPMGMGLGMGLGLGMGMGMPQGMLRQQEFAEESKGGDEIDRSDDGSRKRKAPSQEQQQKRRERNRLLARKTRLRKKFFFQTLQRKVVDLQRENVALKKIVKEKMDEAKAKEILKSCHKELPSVVAECTQSATTLLDDNDFSLMRLLQSNQPSFCVTDPTLPDNPITYASDGFIELSGYSREQVLGRNCRFLQGPGTDPEAVKKIREGIEKGEDTHTLILNYKADGTPFWNNVFVAALRDSSGKIVNFVGVQSPVNMRGTENNENDSAENAGNE